MSMQIAVRLPDELASFIDAEVAAGRAESRAGLVTHALERERRARLAQRDIEILRESDAPDDLDGLAEHAARLPLGLD